MSRLHCSRSVFTSIAGSIYAHYLIVASPDVFGFDTLSIVLTVLLLGGAASITGPVVASFLVTSSTEALSTFGPTRFMIIAVVIVIILRFYPGGLDALIEKLWPRKSAPMEVMRWIQRRR